MQQKCVWEVVRFVLELAWKRIGEIEINLSK